MKILNLALILLTAQSALAQEAKDFLAEISSSLLQRKRVVTEYRYSIEEKKSVPYSDWYSVSHQISIHVDEGKLEVEDKNNTLTGNHKNAYSSERMGAKITVKQESIEGVQKVTICTDGKGVYSRPEDNLIQIHPLNEQFYSTPNTAEGNQTLIDITPAYLDVEADCLQVKSTNNKNEVELLASRKGKELYKAVYKIIKP